MTEDAKANLVLFVRGASHAAFTLLIYFAWAFLVSFFLPIGSPEQLFLIIGSTIGAFVLWISGVDFIASLLEPWRLIPLLDRLFFDKLKK